MLGRARRSRASTGDPLQIHKPVQKIELPLAVTSPLLPSLVPGHQRRIANVTVRLKRLRCCSASHVWGLDISKVSDPKGFAGSVGGSEEGGGEVVYWCTWQTNEARFCLLDFAATWQQ